MSKILDVSSYRRVLASTKECFLAMVAIINLCSVQQYSAADEPADKPFVLSESDQSDISVELNAIPISNTNEARATQLYNIIRAGDGVANAASYQEEGISRMDVLRFNEDGATNGEVQPIKNIVVRLNGEDADSWIVVGAHLDKVDIGAGAIDDWTGCIAVANLYERFRKLEKKDRKHTFIFVCFAYEESGLWGSRTFVEKLKEDRNLNKIKAMINLECLGVSHPHIWKNGSTTSLAQLAEDVAAKSNVEITNRPLQGVGADSVPFFNAGIPAITFDSLDVPNFGKIHSPQDQIASLSMDSDNQPFRMFEAFRFAFDYLRAVDLLPRSTVDHDVVKGFIPQLAYSSFHPGPTDDDHRTVDRVGERGMSNNSSVQASDSNVFVVGSGQSAELIIVRDLHVWRLQIGSLRSGPNNPTQLSH